MKKINNKSTDFTAIDKEKSKKIISRLSGHYEQVNPDLKYSKIYQLTIAVVLSAQTTDRQVNSVTPVLFKKYPDFKSLSRAKQNDMEKLIKSTGFYRNKSKNIIKLSKIIADKHNEKVPDSLDELVKLPGIGRKSANVILSMGHKIPAMAVDTHVLRISNRLGYSNSINPFQVEKDLTSIIPEKDWTIAHLLLIRHGRQLCKARSPLCSKCPVNGLCLKAYSFQ